jgi:ABC-2 type transport system permease protein
MIEDLNRPTLTRQAGAGYSHARPRQLRRWFATVARIAAQLRADPRTVAIILVVPALLITLLYFVFGDAPAAPGRQEPFARIGPLMLVILPMLLMFIVTSVTMLRERTSGTLERLLTTPLSRWSLLASYGSTFGVLGAAQGAVLSTIVLWPMGVDIAGSPVALVLLSLLDAEVGVAFGLFASAFARTEFQAVQFMPIFIGPQIFLCGLLVPKEHMPDLLAAVADWLPMTWSVDAALDIIDNTSLDAITWGRLGLLAGISLVFLGAAAASMPRKTK